ncbi:MAG: hypothetical protein ACR2NB_02605 [Solirubrobacteraceae bacterium]
MLDSYSLLISPVSALVGVLLGSRLGAKQAARLLVRQQEQTATASLIEELTSVQLAYLGVFRPGRASDCLCKRLCEG